MSAETDALKDRIYRDHDTRERVKAALRKRSDVAENDIMALVADTFVDGVRDGHSFGLESTCREAYR